MFVVIREIKGTTTMSDNLTEICHARCILMDGIPGSVFDYVPSISVVNKCLCCYL